MHESFPVVLIIFFFCFILVIPVEINLFAKFRHKCAWMRRVSLFATVRKTCRAKQRNEGLCVLTFNENNLTGEIFSSFNANDSHLHLAMFLSKSFTNNSVDILEKLFTSRGFRYIKRRNSQKEKLFTPNCSLLQTEVSFLLDHEASGLSQNLAPNLYGW